MRTIFLIMLSALVLGCQTPYSGDLGPQDYYGDGIDFDGWETYDEDGIVCYENGFDRYCVKTITHLIEKIIEIIVIKEKRVEIPIDRIVEKYIFLQETIYKDREPTLEETVEFVETEVEVYYGEDNTGDPVEVFTNTPIKDVISEIEQTPIPPISEPPSETTIGDIKTETPAEAP